MIRLLVFDCDGTLVDSQHLISAAMAETFAFSGLAPPALAAVRQVIGLHLDQAIARLLPPDRGADAPALATAYKAVYHRLRADPASAQDPLFPGAREALHALEGAGYLLGMATGKLRRGLRATLERHGLEGLFVTLQSADDAPGKPDPAMVRQAMAEAGAAPGETVVIGDTVFDMQMAANAGARAFGVAWGYHAPQALSAAGATRLLERFEELPMRLQELNGDGG
jgi:phosphoglycolate phosphatase